MKKYLVGHNLIENDVIAGHLCFQTIQSAINHAKGKTQIYLLPGYYYEKLVINKPNITLVGSPNHSSIIYYDVSHGDIIREVDGGDGIKLYGTTGSASVTLLEEAINFRCEKIVFKNTFKREVNGIKTQAVALKTSANNGYYYDCKFISYQDTLYVDKGFNVFEKCFITGDVDFIFGAGQGLFLDCELELIDHGSDFTGYITAPSTLANKDYGFIFYNCFSNYNGKSTYYLGRPWHPSGCKEEMISKVLFLECNFSKVSKYTIMHNDKPEDNMMYFQDIRINKRRYSNISQIEAKHYLKLALNDLKIARIPVKRSF